MCSWTVYVISKASGQQQQGLVFSLLLFLVGWWEGRGLAGGRKGRERARSLGRRQSHLKNLTSSSTLSPASRALLTGTSGVFV